MILIKSHSIKFNELYPNCKAPDPHFISNGKCDDEPIYNTESCGFDGGDCLHPRYPHCRNVDATKLGDKKCDGLFYTTKNCGFDGGDCEFSEVFPNCNISDSTQMNLIGDGKCHARYNVTECRFDGGDCILFNFPNCAVNVTTSREFANRQCNGGEFNTEECGYDGGDCIEFNSKYPNCKVDNPYYVGDGKCHNKFNGHESYNTKECRFDGGDCILSNFPNCPRSVSTSKEFANGRCNGGEFNTEECGYDGGDCTEFNSKYPSCNVDNPSRIGDGICDSWYYKLECGYDGGDCSF